VLAKHYRPEHYDGGPSWLTFFRQMVESLWSITLFQSRSILPIFLSNLIEIGQSTRRIIGYGFAGSHFDQMLLCSLFATGIPMVGKSKSPSHANVQPLSTLPDYVE